MKFSSVWLLLAYQSTLLGFVINIVVFFVVNSHSLKDLRMDGSISSVVHSSGYAAQNAGVPHSNYIDRIFPLMSLI